MTDRRGERKDKRTKLEATTILKVSAAKCQERHGLQAV